MTADLTLAQAISISTKNAIPPFRASSLRKAGETGSLSLRTIRDQVQARQTLLIVQVRDTSIIKASSSFADLQANWKLPNPAWVPPRASMINLINWVRASGVKVARLSIDWRTMLLSGPAAGFCAVQGYMVGNAIDGATPASGALHPENISPSGQELLEGLAIVGAVCLAVAFAPAALVAAPLLLAITGGRRRGGRRLCLDRRRLARVHRVSTRHRRDRAPPGRVVRWRAFQE